MEVILKGEAKEIAALVIAIQERQDVRTLHFRLPDGDASNIIEEYKHLLERKTLSLGEQGETKHSASQERRLRMDLEQRVVKLEKKVADLEGQAQDRTVIEKFLNRLAETSQEATYMLSCDSTVVCECGRTRHTKDAAFCGSCGRKLNRSTS